MPQSISVGVTNFPVGVRTFDIDNLPGNSDAYRIFLTRQAAWNSMSGRMMRCEIWISFDGISFVRKNSAELYGGPASVGPDGNVPTQWGFGATWGGVNNGFGGRDVLRPASIRVIVTVDQAFSADAVQVFTV